MIKLVFSNFIFIFKDDKFYLKQVGLDSDKRFNIEWIDLCRVYARVSQAFIYPVSSRHGCEMYTSNAIIELRVKENSQWNCAWVTELRYSDTSSVQNEIETKFENALDMAANDKNCEASLQLMSQKSIHLSYLIYSNHYARLSATATSKAFFGSGAKCDLTLQAKIIRLVKNL